MKKLLLILLLLFIPCMAFSDALNLGASYGFGYLTEWDCYIMNMDAVFYINPDGMISGAVFGGVEILADLSTEGIAFHPYMDRYSIGAMFNIALFYVSVEHYCLHPVWSSWDQFTSRAYAENCTKIGVGISYNMPYKVNKRGR